MTDDGLDEPVAREDWSRDTQKRALLVWISFLTAAVMSVVFFAFVDPLVLVDAVNVDGVDSRELGYALGFFFFLRISRKYSRTAG